MFLLCVHSGSKRCAEVFCFHRKGTKRAKKSFFFRFSPWRPGGSKNAQVIFKLSSRNVAIVSEPERFIFEIPKAAKKLFEWIDPMLASIQHNNVSLRPGTQNPSLRRNGVKKWASP
ncbi:MAG TPA: hypothetical protein ENJ29_03755 [Bacteroidetes bacterium]|nr:hypothetical protein [Bacteroidota bacterium]